MSDLFLDFETYCDLNLTKVGGINYVNHPSTQIVCLSYAINNGPTGLFTPAKELPTEVMDHVESGQPVYAHGATFDYRVWNTIGVKEFGWPVLSLGQVIDSMALCQTFQLPAKLSGAGAALDISMPKDKDGKALIKLCCCPTKNGVQPTPWGVNGVYFPRLYDYGIRDTDAMRQIVYKLPRKILLPKEQRLWELTYEMNTLGLPIDYEAVKAISYYLVKYIEEALKEVPKKSGGAFKTMGQIQKIKDWCEANGYLMPSLNAQMVQEGIDDPNCPENVRDILYMRQELGRSSTAKYAKLLNLAVKRDDGYWVCDNVQFHGAGPGRWAGRGFQVHNLPRVSVKNPEEKIQEFLDAVKFMSVSDPMEKIQQFLEGLEETTEDIDQE